MKNAAKHILYAILVIIALNIAATEGIARLLNQEPFKPLSLNLKVTPSHLPFFKADSLLGYKMETGAFSMKYPDGYVFTATNTANGYRKGIPYDSAAIGDIWVFGCSYTYGWAVADSQTFCYKLDKRLTDFNIKNYGVSGYGTTQNLLDLKQQLKLEKQPHAVIFTYAFIHDERNGVTPSWLWKNATFSKLTGPIEVPKAGLIDSALSISYIPLVYDPWTLSDKSAFMFWLERKNMKTLDEEFANTGTTEAILLEAQRLCYAKGIGFAVALIMDDDRTRAIGEFCRANNINVELIAPDWDTPGITNAPTDPHPSPAGHDSMAQGLYKLLTNPVTN